MCRKATSPNRANAHANCIQLQRFGPALPRRDADEPANEWGDAGMTDFVVIRDEFFWTRVCSVKWREGWEGYL